ncbi:MAG: hypothetical protein MJB14_07340, partial [Spirochaetes bacterium]|nr:hypothetical protein [Spirochaetota bacterium]
MLEEWYLKELISKNIQDIWKLTDYYLLKLIDNILNDTKIDQYLQNPTTISEIIVKKQYPEKVYSSLKWLLDRLVLDGYAEKLTHRDENKYQLTDKKVTFNLQEILKQAKQKAPNSIAAFNMLSLMAKHYPEYLEGKKSGVDIIFSPENIEVTNEYYINNLFYNVHNKGGAKILNWDIDQRSNPEILEIGCGLGGG